MHGRARRKSATLLATGAIYALSAGCGWAQEVAVDDPDKDLVIVTARKRSEALQDVPQSVQAITAETIERIGATTFADVLARASGVGGTTTSQGSLNLNIRGVQAVGEQNFGQAPTGFYIDETPISAAATIPDVALADLERVEVLRGPQGTLYGEGSLGGTIRVVTRAPQLARYEASAMGIISNTKGGELSYYGFGVANIPIGEDFAIRVSGSYNDRGGFLDNLNTGLQDTNFTEIGNARFVALYQPFDEFSATFSYTRFDLDAGAPSLQTLNGPDLTIDAAFQERAEQEFDLYNLTLNWELPWFDVVSSSSYYDRDEFLLLDDAATAALGEVAFGALLFGPGGVLPLPGGGVAPQLTTERTFTQETRFSGEALSQRLFWTAGFFYRNQDRGVSVSVTGPDLLAIPPLAPLAEVFFVDGGLNIVDVAGFGEATYEVFDGLRLTGGLRYFSQTQDGDTAFNLLVPSPPLGPGILSTGLIPVDQDTNGFLYKGGIDWKPSDNVLLYALFTRGVRGGGVNFRRLLPFIPPTFGPDKTVNREVGLKTTWLDGKFLFNLALYRTRWNDVQTLVSPIAGLAFTDNVGQAVLRGAELETVLRPAPWLTLGGALAYIDAEISEDVLITDADPTTTADDIFTLEGTPLPFTPELKFNVYADLVRDLTPGLRLTGRVDWEYTGARPNQLQTNLPPLVTGFRNSPAYGTLRLAGGLETNRYAFSLFATNLLDRRGEIFAADPINEGVELVRPRTYGVILRASY